MSRGVLDIRYTNQRSVGYIRFNISQASSAMFFCSFNFVEPAFARSKNSNKFGFHSLTRSFVLLSKIISIVAVLPLCIFNNLFLLFYNFLQHIFVEMCIFFVPLHPIMIDHAESASSAHYLFDEEIEDR